MQLNLWLITSVLIIFAIHSIITITNNDIKHRTISIDEGYWDDILSIKENSTGELYLENHHHHNSRQMKREIYELNEFGMRVYNVGVLMASNLGTLISFFLGVHNKIIQI